MGLAADIGTLQRFPKITGNDSLARELALTGRKFDAVEAKDIGFISEVVKGGRKEVVGEYISQRTQSNGEVVDEMLMRVGRALGMAKTIAEKSPIAVISTKHLMNRELVRTSCPVNVILTVQMRAITRT